MSLNLVILVFFSGQTKREMIHNRSSRGGPLSPSSVPTGSYPWAGHRGARLPPLWRSRMTEHSLYPSGLWVPRVMVAGSWGTTPHRGTQLCVNPRPRESPIRRPSPRPGHIPHPRITPTSSLGLSLWIVPHGNQTRVPVHKPQ